MLVSGNTLVPFLNTRTPQVAKLVEGTKVLVCKEVSDGKTYDSKGQWLGTNFCRCGFFRLWHDPRQHKDW